MPFLLIVLWPLLEILTFIRVCALIGTLNALLLCVLSGLIGWRLLARVGTDFPLTARRTFTANAMPEDNPFDRIWLGIAGLLLILPGFLSDALAVLLLIPAFRRVALPRTFASAHFHATRRDYGRASESPAADVIEGDYERLE